MKVTGAITQIKEKVTGKSKSDKGWSKVEFLLETSEDYNNVYCFEIFAMDGAEKNNVESFMKFNKVGSNVDVEFNVKTSEWKGKHFTSLSAWKVFKADLAASGGEEIATPVEDDLPF